jgi:hypothetical protein
MRYLLKTKKPVLIGDGPGRQRLAGEARLSGKTVGSVTQARSVLAGCAGPAPAPGVNSSVVILLGNGDGSFRNGAVYSLANVGPVAVLDLNRDGRPDLVTPDGVLLGNGDGTFNIGQRGAFLSLATVTVGDFNGDGNPDLAVGYEGQSSISIFLSRGDGTFSGAITCPTSSSFPSYDYSGPGDPAMSVSSRP